MALLGVFNVEQGGLCMWDRCKLEGVALDAKVAELEGFKFYIDSLDPTAQETQQVVWVIDDGESGGGPWVFSPSTSWSDGGPLLERDQIFIDPPHDTHVLGGPNAGWNKTAMWTATVSARTRTRPNPNDPTLPATVGRGAGPTLLVAAMRAYVDSKTPNVVVSGPERVRSNDGFGVSLMERMYA